jgi:hypothetical protein
MRPGRGGRPLGAGNRRLLQSLAISLARAMGKDELRATSYELRATSYELRATKEDSRGGSLETIAGGDFLWRGMSMPARMSPVGREQQTREQLDTKGSNRTGMSVVERTGWSLPDRRRVD